jgi:tetratricopeptide (TPR) repeat protein
MRHINTFIAAVLAGLLLLHSYQSQVAQRARDSAHWDLLTVSYYNPQSGDTNKPCWTAASRDKRAINILYARIKALSPVQGAGPTSCPNDIGTYYQLTFTSQDGRISKLKVEETGCNFVTALDGDMPARCAWASAPLFRALKSYRPPGASPQPMSERYDEIDIQQLTKQLSPENDDKSLRWVYEGRAKTYLKLGKFAPAEKDMTKSLRLTNSDELDTMMPRLERAYAMHMLGRNEEALEDLNYCIKKHPQEYPVMPEAYAARAEVYQAVGKNGPAANDLQTLAYETGRNMRKRQQLCAYYFRRAGDMTLIKRYDQAVDYYNKDFAICPDKSELFQPRGFAYEMLGQHQKALADFGQAIKNNPQDRTSYYERAEVFVNLGDDESAQKDWDTASKVLTMSETKLNLRQTILNQTGAFNPLLAPLINYVIDETQKL